jgi:Spy/CpxP family protein refolding chaperone
VRAPGIAGTTLGILLVVAGGTAAQSPHAPAGHRHAPGDGGEAHRRVDTYLKEFDAVVADGRGFGLAFAADQNGYPGPLHVLELKDRLQLTPAQETQMRALFATMLDQARPRAERLAAAEARLRRLFADGVADDAAVRAAVADTEAARADLRLAHLSAHLRARDVLTETQRRTYHEARWGTGRDSMSHPTIHEKR